MPPFWDPIERVYNTRWGKEKKMDWKFKKKKCRTNHFQKKKKVIRLNGFFLPILKMDFDSFFGCRFFSAIRLNGFSWPSGSNPVEPERLIGRSKRRRRRRRRQKKNRKIDRFFSLLSNFFFYLTVVCVCVLGGRKKKIKENKKEEEKSS